MIKVTISEINTNRIISCCHIFLKKTRKRLKKRAEASQLKVLTSKSSPEATCNKVVTRVVNSTVVNGTSSQRPGESAILTLDGENSQVTKVR